MKHQSRHVLKKKQSDDHAKIRIQHLRIHYRVLVKRCFHIIHKTKAFLNSSTFDEMKHKTSCLLLIFINWYCCQYNVSMHQRALWKYAWLARQNLHAVFSYFRIWLEYSNVFSRWRKSYCREFMQTVRTLLYSSQYNYFLPTKSVRLHFPTILQPLGRDQS